MDNIVTNLVGLADRLDRKGMVKQAIAIDKIAANLDNIKTAQYVGIQGYWIRNERCWSNCYRIKRASNPSMGAYEVWKECQNEYVDSLNNDSDTWDKYAGGDNQAIQKFAGKQLEKANDIIKAEGSTFRREVNEKIASGVPTPVAIYDTITSNMNKYAQAAINSSSELLKISKQLPENEKDNIKQLAVLAEQIVREAKGFGGFWEDLKGVGRGIKNIVTKQPKGTTAFENLLSRLQNLLQSASSIMQDAQSFMATPSTHTTPPAAQDASYTESGSPGMMPQASYNQNMSKIAQTSLPLLKQDFDRFYQQLLQEGAYLMKRINMLQTTGGISSGMVGQLQGAIRLISALTKAYPTMMGKLNTGDVSAIAYGMRDFTSKMNNVLSGIQSASKSTAPETTAPETTIPETVSPGQTIIPVAKFNEIWATQPFGKSVGPDKIIKFLNDLGITIQ